EPKPVKKTKKKDQDQIERDVKAALKIQANLNEEARIKRKRQEEASKAALAKMYDEVQAQINADHELAVRLTHEEQEKYIGASIQSIDPPLSTGHTVGSGEDEMEHESVLTNPVPQAHYDSPLSGDEDADTEMIIEDKGNGEKGGSIKETISTARPDISAARPEVSTAEPKTPPTTTTLFDDKDVTIADTL
nr:hypothetical protein [Tanacetum cinerariifolium]